MRHENALCINDGWRFQLGEITPERIGEEELAEWESVTLPHSWNALDTMEVEPERHYRRAVGWYVREIEPAAPGERLWLEFEAAAQRASVWLNGLQIGEHLGGYTAFTVELPERMMAGAGRRWLAVRVDNLPDPDLIPSDMSDFFLYGGLTRNVWRVTSGAHRLVSLHCRSEIHMPGATLSLRGALDSPPGELHVQAQLFSPQHALIARIEHTIHDDEAFVCPDVVLPAVELWSPEQPALYTLHVTVGNGQGEIWDKVSEQIGLRDFTFPAGGPITLNGLPITLHGTHRHEDWAGYGSAVPDELTHQEMRQIKEAGFNFVRLGHYPQAPAVLEACDELGLLVWEELPWCRGGVGGPVFQQRTLTMLSEMIEQHFNHPSIVFWGLGNELDWDSEHPASTDEKVSELLSALHRFAKQRDPQRLTALRRFERGAALVDVYSPSLWSGWYRGRYEDYEEALNAELARYPRMLHVEWGGDSHAGRYTAGPHLSVTIAQESDHAERPGLATMDDDYPPRASRHGDWSESYMLDLMEWHLQVQACTPRLAGSAQWIFKDFGTPLRPENPIPYVNQKGLVDRAGRPKALYALFQSYLTSAPMCYIEAPGWPLRRGQPGAAQRVRVYANCPRVTLFLNGTSCGERQRDSTAFPAAGLVWHIHFRPGSNSLRAVGISSQGKEVEHSVSLEYYEGVTGPGVAFTWQIEAVNLPSGESGKHISVQLVDASGQPVTTDRQRVTFHLQGPGSLLGRLGTSDGSRLVELANGRASITVLNTENTLLLVQGASASTTISL